MKQKQHLVIILPECMAELPVRIIRGSNIKELILNIRSSDDEPVCMENTEHTERKYAFIWRKEDYLKVALDEIKWIEASGSYCVIHLTRKRDMTVSFNLAVIKKELPVSDFVQIHRSYVINLGHVIRMTGNILTVGDRLLTIGREYRESFLNRVIFLGVRRNRRKT